MTEGSVGAGHDIARGCPCLAGRIQLHSSSTRHSLRAPGNQSSPGDQSATSLRPGGCPRTRPGVVFPAFDAAPPDTTLRSTGAWHQPGLPAVGLSEDFMRQFKPVLLATGLLAGVIPPAIQPAAAQHPLTAAQRPAARIRLFAVDSAHGRASLTQGLVLGFVSYLADDAVYLEPGADHVHGKRRIQALLEGQPAGQRLSFHPGLAEVSADGTTGYTVGWTTLT